jgi:hypothetical protein
MKILKIAIVAALILAAFLAGKSHGKIHAIADSTFYIVDFDEWQDPLGNDFDTRLLIELDGDLYEQGLYIG